MKVTRYPIAKVRRRDATKPGYFEALCAIALSVDGRHVVVDTESDAWSAFVDRWADDNAAARLFRWEPGFRLCKMCDRTGLSAEGLACLRGRAVAAQGAWFKVSVADYDEVARRYPRDDSATR